MNLKKHFLKNFLKLNLIFMPHKNYQLFFYVLIIFLLLKNLRLFYYLNFNKNFIMNFQKMFKIFNFIIILQNHFQKSLKIHFYLYFNKFIHYLIQVKIFMNFLDRMLQIQIFFLPINLRLKILLNFFHFFLFLFIFMIQKFVIHYQNFNQSIHL